jgi:hypothetical protein
MLAQYEKVIVPRFKTIEHTEVHVFRGIRDFGRQGYDLNNMVCQAGLTKIMLGLGDTESPNQPPPVQGDIDYSRIDQIHPWEDSSGGGLEKYHPCVTSVFAPPMFQVAECFKSFSPVLVGVAKAGRAGPGRHGCAVAAGAVEPLAAGLRLRLPGLQLLGPQALRARPRFPSCLPLRKRASH